MRIKVKLFYVRCTVIRGLDFEWQNTRIIQEKNKDFWEGFFSKINLLQTSLGLKVEQELMRQQRDRQGRRQVFGEIEVKQTARFGKICSPYQALTTPVSTTIFFKHIDGHSFSFIFLSTHFIISERYKIFLHEYFSLMSTYDFSAF